MAGPRKGRKFLFATAGGKMTRCEINAIPAGRFLIVERREGEDVEHLGEYSEILRPSRLAFTFVVPKYSPVSTRVSIEIAPGETGCELKLTNLGIPEAIAAKSNPAGAEFWMGSPACLTQARTPNRSKSLI